MQTTAFGKHPVKIRSLLPKLIHKRMVESILLIIIILLQVGDLDRMTDLSKMPIYAGISQNLDLVPDLTK